MEIKLEKFMSKESCEKLRKFNLHKIAALMEKSSGSNFDEIDLAAAVTLLGEKQYLKEASHKKILEGIEAFKSLTEGE